MTAPATTQEAVTVTVGSAAIPYSRPHLPGHFPVFQDGRKVGEMWRYGTKTEPRWRGYRDGHGTSLSDHPTQEEAAAAVGWRVRINAYQLAFRSTAQDDVRIVSPGGDVAKVVMAAAEEGMVVCTAIVSGDTVQTLLNEHGCSAVRRHVAAAFGVSCVGGGQRGSTGDPVVLLTMPADHKVILTA